MWDFNKINQLISEVPVNFNQSIVLASMRFYLHDQLLYVY